MILITGVTGFLGRELLKNLLNSDPSSRFLLLVRGKSQDDAARRVNEIIQEISPFASAELISRVEVINADLSLDFFGLGQSQFDDIAKRTLTIFHSAANTDLNQELNLARKVNVGGTDNIVKLCRRAKELGNSQIFLNHISTAYVAGDKKGTVQAEAVSIYGSFRNTYERSKAEAEALVRTEPDLNFCIFRPSIIVGNSVNGYTKSFNVIYLPARLLSKGLFKIFPANPLVPFDLVPIDYVADAITTFHTQHLITPGGCYHITAGLGRETTIGEIIEQVVKAVHKYTDELAYVPPIIPLETIFSSLNVAVEGIKALEKIIMTNLPVFKQAMPFLPYMNHNPLFDNSTTQKLLEKHLQPAPLFKQYADVLFRYCFETNWGRKKWEGAF